VKNGIVIVVGMERTLAKNVDQRRNQKKKKRMKMKEGS
jgi:hypothetical protein